MYNLYDLIQLDENYEEFLFISRLILVWLEMNYEY